MRYLTLATDYDGTLADDGVVSETTLDALRRLRESGRRLILVTGRRLEDLQHACSDCHLFDWIVAENGALLYSPHTKEVRPLRELPPTEFIAELQRRGVGPLEIGHVIVATWEPHEHVVLETIRDLGLELHVIFNKGAVMILPAGVTKTTGLTEALDELGLSPHNAVSIGDAENDHAFLRASGCAVAVANALPALKQEADVVMQGDHGRGVSELIEMLLEDDLASISSNITRHNVQLGWRENGAVETIAPFGENVLICGTSGSGKSTLTTGILERLTDRNYQFAILDPEGDYSEIELAVALGSPDRVPLAKEVVDLLHSTHRNASINLLGVGLGDRPAFADEILSQLTELRSRKGHPHWIVIDEAHHVFPTAWRPSVPFHFETGGYLLVTVHPESVAATVLSQITSLIAVGEHPSEMISAFCAATQHPLPEIPRFGRLAAGEALFWRRSSSSAVLLRTEPPKTERKRHSRKYAEGNLGEECSFYFRGPQKQLCLRCQNLVMFLQISDGVDEATWSYHLRQGDYSRWMRECIKDPDLADEIATIENEWSVSANESRARIRKAISGRYTLPEA